MKIFKLKGHETLKLFLLLVLCLSLLVPSNLKSQDILKVSEVYDYEVGDVFQYDIKEYWYFQKYIKYTITDKYYSSDNKTLYYVRSYKRHSKLFDEPNWTIIYGSDTIFYTNLDSLICEGSIDSSFSDTLYNGRLINCNVTYANEDTITRYYVQACGLALEQRYVNSNNYLQHHSLIYFKKGDEEWGEQFPPVLENISTIAEIYDFDIGDVFHYVEENDSYFPDVSGTAITNTAITNKNYTPNNDTVFYERDIKKKTTIGYDTLVEFIHDTIFYTNLDAGINNGNIDSSYSIPGEYNGRLTNIKKIVNPDGETSTTLKYTVGCGKSYHNIINPGMHWNFWYINLVYFKKGDEEWGTPENVLYPDNIETFNDNYGLQIYPNPAISFVTIESKTKIKSVSILSFQGKRIKSFTIESEKASIDISGLTSNVYILEFDFGDNLVHKKLIKE